VTFSARMPFQGYNALPCIQPNPEVVQAVQTVLLCSEAGAARAALAVGNMDIQKALHWAMDHRGDEGFDEPIAPEAPFSLPEGPPVLSFGVIADIQYADAEDGQAFSGTKRYYRHALEAVHMATAAWNEEEGRVAFIAQLGDIIDGRNQRDGTSRTALDTVMKALAASPVPVQHLIGNHELYNFSRAELPEIVTPPYSSHTPFPGWRFIRLDGFEYSTVGWGEGHACMRTAQSLLKAFNPNDCTVTDGSVNWKSGLTGTEQRWLPYNGALGPQQIAWLTKELSDAVFAGEKVVVMCHIPVQPGACVDSCLLWNYEEVSP